MLDVKRNQFYRRQLQAAVRQDPQAAVGALKHLDE